MNILAFDTSFETMYATLAKDGAVLDARIVENSERGYNSAFLISTIADIMQKNSLKMQDIDAIGVNIGPGSFTGLRACATVARVIAQQLEIPVVGLPSFQIYSMLNNNDKKTFCIMDARRGSAYVGIYDADSNPIMQPCALEYEEALKLAQSEDFYIISDSRMTKKLEELGLEYTNFQQTKVDYGVFAAKLAQRELDEKGSESFKWHDLKPLYIQPPPIHTSKKSTQPQV